MSDYAYEELPIMEAKPRSIRRHNAWRASVRDRKAAGVVRLSKRGRRSNSRQYLSFVSGRGTGTWAIPTYHHGYNYAEECALLHMKEEVDG